MILINTNILILFVFEINNELYETDININSISFKLYLLIFKFNSIHIPIQIFIQINKETKIRI